MNHQRRQDTPKDLEMKEQSFESKISKIVSKTQKSMPEVIHFKKNKEDSLWRSTCKYYLATTVSQIQGIKTTRIANFKDYSFMNRSIILLI